MYAVCPHHHRPLSRTAKRPKQAAAAAADNYKRQNNYSHTVEAKTKQKKNSNILQTYQHYISTPSLLIAINRTEWEENRPAPNHCQRCQLPNSENRQHLETKKYAKTVYRKSLVRLADGNRLLSLILTNPFSLL